MVEIGQSHGELLDVLTSKYTGGSQKMQDEKTALTSTPASTFHPAPCRLLCWAAMLPSASFSVSWPETWHFQGKVKGSPRQALEEVLRIVAEEALSRVAPGFGLTFPEYKED